MNRLKNFMLIPLVLAVLFSFQSCSKDKMEKRQTLRELYKTYKNGEIAECTCNGETVFSVVLNAYDAYNSIYDKEGNLLGTCNYGWGSVDTVCGQLSACEAVYRVKDNIWGEPAVDKYHLK